MTFRTKLSLIFVLTIVGTVSAVAYGVTHYTQTAFEEMDAQRTNASVSQFKKEFTQSGEQITQQVKNIADADITLRAAIDLARPNADQSLYVHDATGAAQDHQLDFVQLAGTDGTIISSAQFPSKVGTKLDWLAGTKDWNSTPAFFKKEDLPDGSALSLTAVRSLSGGNDKNLYIIGGRRLDQNFLSTLLLPSGMRALLYVNLNPDFSPTALLTSAKEGVEQPERLQPMIDQIRKQPQSLVQTVNWNSDAGSAETFHAMPLIGRNNESERTAVGESAEPSGKSSFLKNAGVASSIFRARQPIELGSDLRRKLRRRNDRSIRSGELHKIELVILRRTGRIVHI